MKWIEKKHYRKHELQMEKEKTEKPVDSFLWLSVEDIANMR